MEMESEEKRILFTPCTNVRKNLLSKFENSQDSGIFSITPSSREQSYKSIPDDHSFGTYNGCSYLMTPSSDNEGVQLTPNVISESGDGYYSRSKSNSEQNKNTNDLHKAMKKLNCTSIIKNVAQKGITENVDQINEESVYMDCEEESFDLRIANDLPLACTISHNEKNFVSEDVKSTMSTFIHFQTESSATTCSHSASHLTSMQSTPKKQKSPKRRKLSKLKQSSLWRSLYGFEYVDILYFLGQKGNFTGVVTKILSYLSIKDLLNVCAVSKTWQKICKDDIKAGKRLKLHKEACAKTQTKENYFMKAVEGRKRNGSRILFSNIQNIQEGSPMKTSSPSASPRTRRFQQFWKEGAKLEKDSKLMICPECRSPVHCNNNSDRLGECKKCCYKFCTLCQSKFHYPTRCYRISSLPSVSNRTRKDLIIGSKASKRRLSRT